MAIDEDSRNDETWRSRSDDDGRPAVFSAILVVTHDLPNRRPRKKSHAERKQRQPITTQLQHEDVQPMITQILSNETWTGGGNLDASLAVYSQMRDHRLYFHQRYFTVYELGEGYAAEFDRWPYRLRFRLHDAQRSGLQAEAGLSCYCTRCAD